MDVPERIYVKINHPISSEYTEIIAFEEGDGIEYCCTDAFIEKACEFLKSYRQDIYNGEGYIAGIINDKTIKDFVKYMEGE